MENYSEILELLKKWRKESRAKVLDVHPRLKETYLYLNSAFSLFLQYCVDKDFVLPQDAEQLLCDFRSLMLPLICKQSERSDWGKVNSTRAEADYLRLVSTMCKDGVFRVSDTKEHFNDNAYDGLIHSGCIWLRTDKFKEKIRQYYPTINFENMISTLAIQNALKLKPSEKRHTNQIYGMKGIRFYAIWLDKLK